MCLAYVCGSMPVKVRDSVGSPKGSYEPHNASSSATATSDLNH